MKLHLKGYRTILFNLVNAIVPVMQAVDASYAIPAAWMPYWLAIYIVGNVILRLMTTTPVGKK